MSPKGQKADNFPLNSGFIQSKVKFKALTSTQKLKFHVFASKISHIRVWGKTVRLQTSCHHETKDNTAQLLPRTGPWKSILLIFRKAEAPVQKVTPLICRENAQLRFRFWRWNQGSRVWTWVRNRCLSLTDLCGLQSLMVVLHVHQSSQSAALSFSVQFLIIFRGMFVKRRPTNPSSTKMFKFIRINPSCSIHRTCRLRLTTNV